MGFRAVLSNEFIDDYKDGMRIFSGINLQYMDISGIDLDDLVIKDSKIFFVNFRGCSLLNAKFINCEIFWGGFYNNNMKNVIFDRCKIDMTWFENVIFENSKMIQSTASWSAMLNSNSRELDTSSSTLFKFFTDPSQASPNDIEEFMHKMGPVVASLDMSIRAKFMEGLKSDLARYGVEAKPVETQDSGYAKDTGYKQTPVSYGSFVSDFSNAVINAYGMQQQKKKTPYER